MEPEQAWQVVEYNERLVSASVLDWCKRNGHQYDDYISAGYEGAHRAVQTYDPSRKTKLSFWMWKLIQNECNSAWHREERKSTYRTSYPPKGKKGKRTYEWNTFPAGPRYVNEGDESELSVFDIRLAEEFEDDLIHELDVEQAWEDMEPYLLQLNETDQGIIRDHYWGGETFEAIGKKLGMSRAGANLRFWNAIGQIREALREEMVS